MLKALGFYVRMRVRVSFEDLDVFVWEVE